MKLLRIKITAPDGFRSLQNGFEHDFRTEWSLQEEQGFAPFVCAGKNGSGKSNLLEVVTAIFYHMECIYLENLPDSFRYEEDENEYGFRSEIGIPNGFEIEYLIDAEKVLDIDDGDQYAHIKIVKKINEAPKWFHLNYPQHKGEKEITSGQAVVRKLLPNYILGYSSGENEILSLPFIKMRFLQFDEYWQALKSQLPYPGRPESRFVYLDSSFSQAIVLCNLLFQDDDTLKPFREDVGIESLDEFRIIIRHSIELDEGQVLSFGNYDQSKVESIEEIVNRHPALRGEETEFGYIYHLNIIELLDGDEKSDKIITRLKRCATCWFDDEQTDSLYLDYCVNDDTKLAFKENFDYEENKSPITLFHALQVLLTLNLYSSSDTLKADLYRSDSLYFSETVPTLASDQRIMRFKNFWVTKSGVHDPILLKSLSDGEHQLLHSLGLCLLFKNTNSLFLLDEPETHFNPDWRSNFISILKKCFKDSNGNREMLITTHAPFLISDSKPDHVLIFEKNNNEVKVSPPEYNTLGASINKITMQTFNKKETIGGVAEEHLKEFREKFDEGRIDKKDLLRQIRDQLGDSVEKTLLINTILNSMEKQT